MIGNIYFGNAIVFFELDIPKTGIEHTKALNIAVDYGSIGIPKVLVDNGSSVNVCPSTTLAKLGISLIDLAPCARTIRAYDNTYRNVLCIVSLGLTLGAVSMKVDFYVMDIAATFNLLLGKPWIHKVKGLSSTLHQMIKFPNDHCIVTIMAKKYVGQGKGFTSFSVLKEKIGYPFGLGYVYTPVDVSEYIREERNKLRGKGKSYDYLLRPYRKTLNGYFVREGEDVSYLLFPEPWVDKNNGRHPEFENFEDVALAEAMEKQLMLAQKRTKRKLPPPKVIGLACSRTIHCAYLTMVSWDD